MADFTGTTTVSVPPRSLFDFLSNVGNLPRYFARMTSASADTENRNEVHTTATLPDGSQVEGKAWFEVDPDNLHITWGSEGESDYHGYLDVTPQNNKGEAPCDVEVHIHTTRVEEGDRTVQDGVDETLATIKKLLEEQDVTEHAR